MSLLFLLRNPLEKFCFFLPTFFIFGYTFSLSGLGVPPSPLCHISARRTDGVTAISLF